MGHLSPALEGADVGVVIDFEVSNRCNAKCHFCPRDQTPHQGSMPPDVHREIRRAVGQGRLAVRVASVVEASLTDDIVSLHCEGGHTISADRVVLATGFEAPRPGGELIDRAISDLGLRCASCGYPVVDASLQWHPGIHVTGALAELEIGPVARNIIGARLAAERLTSA